MDDNRCWHILRHVIVRGLEWPTGQLAICIYSPPPPVQSFTSLHSFTECEIARKHWAMLLQTVLAVGNSHVLAFGKSSSVQPASFQVHHCHSQMGLAGAERRFISC
ncbi:hypothetical protein VFPPC_16731 [Pochonia chlamydosporia 170]|uniref:Uncharacterized protein n=1 Tax=Pochonia chlamydosporia 170 TaxID=1380566 RepID=A0A179F4Y3_METCM|nr:hypothetical protein VFPPC_16731 [Pochonia chlamydosporia 170]OAQ60486.1 hypothetical protein VFPPC_16731 [Pochonia chlamydosporia 170]